MGKLYRKINLNIRLFLIFILFTIFGCCMQGRVNAGPVSAGQVNKSIPYSSSTGYFSSINVDKGSLAYGTAELLNEKDEKCVVFNSATEGDARQVKFLLDVDLSSDANCIKNLEIASTIKASKAGTTTKMYLFNYTTNNYDVVNSDSVDMNYIDYIYKCKDTSKLANYISNNKLKLMFELSNTVDFTAYVDYLSILHEYHPSGESRSISTYNVDNATIEDGTISSNKATALKDRDNTFFSVTSAANKVAWNSTITLNQPKKSVKTLIIDYSGNCSTKCNNTWLALWNFQTENWEVVNNFASDTTTRSLRWITSDSSYLNKFISEFNDVKVRLYNSASTSFTRNADYLNVTVEYDTANSIKTYAPDYLQMDYGTISNGDVNTLKEFDNTAVSINSDLSNKVAWKCGTVIDVDKQYINAITVMTRVSTNNSTNNLNFSFWNYKTNNWEVRRVSTSSVQNENLIMSITDPEDIDKFISDNGQIQVRLYNSAKGAFVRDTDFVNFIIEYGTVGTFEFAHLSDVHELIGQNNFKSIINDLNNNIKPDFTIITGDITDHGLPQQYDQYVTDLQLLNGTKYTTTGNHDVRWWNSNGKKDWETKIGPRYYSFNYKGVHFVILDSTVQFNLDEKFGKAQLEWVKNDLKSIDKGMPVLFFAHHPFHMYNNVTGIDELLEVSKENNVVAYISGHQHYYGNSIENGVTWEFISDVKDDPVIPFCTIKVTPNKLYIYKRQESNNSKALWLTAPMNNNRKASMTITKGSPQVNGNVDINVAIDKAPDGVAKVEARIDNYGPWTSLTKNGNGWNGTIDISKYSPALPYGKHFIQVYMTDTKGAVWKEYMDYEWVSENVTTKWTFQTGDIIQSTPTYYNGVVYAGSEDGKLYAIQDADGSLKWSYTTGDQIISKPAIYNRGDKNLVIFGSQDKKLYALDAETGTVEWIYTTEGSVLSDPVVDGTTVYFGSGDKYIYALNANDGMLKWKSLTNGLMRQKPVIYKDKLYAFIRDTNIWYAYNTIDGSLYWKGNAATDESMWVCGDVRPIILGEKLWCIDAQNTRAAYLNLQTGALEWTSSEIIKSSSRGMTTDGVKVFYPSNEGSEIYAVNAADNTSAWHTDLRANASNTDSQQRQIDSGLVYESGIIYHVADRGRITGIDSETGNVKFIYDAVGYAERAFWSTPEVHNKTVYIGGLDGKIYAVKYNGN